MYFSMYVVAVSCNSCDTDLRKPTLCSPPVIVVHGPEATGKTDLVTSYLETHSTQHAIVQSRECITARHLFERAVGTCASVLGSQEHQNTLEPPPACENVNALANVLASLLQDVSSFVLVLDGVDEQRDATSSLLPALARIADLVSLHGI